MSTTLADAMLAEFEQEAAITRKFLERLPADKLAWKPHDKSMTAGQLALHMAQVPGQVAEMTVPNTIPPPSFGLPPQPDSVQQVLEALEASIGKVRSILPAFDDNKMQESWGIEADGKMMFALPRAAALRMIMLSHWIQHRGQFSVYLRLMGEMVPSSYGPSADELPAFAKQAQGA